MAMTESSSQQLLVLDPSSEGPSLAGPASSSSSSPSPALLIDDLKRTKLDAPSSSSAAASSSRVHVSVKDSGPTPPSSPSQHIGTAAAAAAAAALAGDATDNVASDAAPPDTEHEHHHHDNIIVNSSSSSSSSVDQPGADLLPAGALAAASSSPRLIHQQPTPPSTLPEDAAFPQAATDHHNLIVPPSSVEDSSSVSSSSQNPVTEPYLVEREEDPLPQPISGTRSASPAASPRSSSSSLPSTLNDDEDDDNGVPTLDANEAAFLLEADAMESNLGNNNNLGTTANSDSPAPIARPTALPRIPSSSSQHSTLADLPTLQIPQHSPPVPFQPHQTGSQYSFPYASTLDSRISSSTTTTATTSRPERDLRTPLSPEVPPWQPDSEVSNCPICTTTFSFFYRKHHCRKCGRVVCAPCSPHRIVIPRSFVVYPPNSIDPDLSSQAYVDSAGNRRSSFGGGDAGVEVRICNQCLAGDYPSSSSSSNQRRQSIQSPPGGAGRFWQDFGPPTGVNANNYVPPQNVAFGGNHGAPRRRTVSSGNNFSQAHGGQGYPGAMYHHHYGQAHSLGRNQHGAFPGQPHPPYHSHPVQQQLPPLQHPTPSYPLPQPGHHNFSFVPAQFYPSPQPPQHHHQHQGHQRSVSSSSHPYSQYSPINQPISGHLDTSQRPVPAFSMPDTSRPNLPIAGHFMHGNTLRELQTHSAPPQPRLKETDYCPICQNVLPPPNPVTRDETAREAHIQQCIDNTISGNSSSVARRRSTSGAPSSHASLANTTMSSQPSASHQSTSIPTPNHQPQPSDSVRRSRASSRPTGGRMFVYTATAKDTLPSGSDAKADDQKAECVICFEEFEEGDSIARLECFCRYHKKCITDWFNRRGDGQCPVHAMNE
ncbi:hypothetical protein H072_4394 [Dactylellina haptotyla CBS 200.50]|uniref:FYVE-type domain-containing protein n=1 Tax=Dactylellina haptotyla (strain CBS 200.50) TaxID=1284197 RepID=S8C261_DACHA|nr:hypothetical protein H072_4394 [Dactylellina haptotyla CBS 200.50]